jgi:streptogramin lyase
MSFVMFVSHLLLSIFLSQLLFAQPPQPGTTASLDQNVKVPPGSYQLTCLMVDLRKDQLRTICQTQGGDWLDTELRNPSACTADISNENGKLTCNRSQNGPPEDDLPGAYFEAYGEGAPELDQSFGPWAPSQTMKWQLQHVTWTFKDGVPENVLALAQTDDGYLWLGGYGGLYRFDGKRFELFRSPFGEELLSTNISSLYAPPAGGLWIGYTFGGASFIDKGRVRNYGGEFATSSGSMGLITQDKDGIVWAASLSSGLWRFEDSHWEHIGTEWNVALKSANEVAVDRDGSVWVSGQGTLLRLPAGSRRFQVVQQNIPDTQRFSYAGKLLDREGNLWFRSTKGIDRFYYSPLIKQEFLGEVSVAGGYIAIAADVDGKVWASGPRASLYHLAPGGTRVLPNHAGWTVEVMYRAPDGTIWLGGNSGVWHETLSPLQPLRGPNESDRVFEMRKALWNFTGRDWHLFKLPQEETPSRGGGSREVSSGNYARLGRKDVGLAWSARVVPTDGRRVDAIRRTSATSNDRCCNRIHRQPRSRVVWFHEE